MELKERRALILAAVIREYINTGHPVGSKELAQSYDLGASPATIRSEMARLEKEGYLVQPHTSAGRVPTDKGYKVFVQELMKHFELSEKERRRLRAELAHLQRQHEELGRSISKLLAETTKQAAFALLPQAAGSAGAANLVSAEARADELKEAVSFLEEVKDRSPELLEEYFREEPEVYPHTKAVGKRASVAGNESGVGVYIGKEMKLASTSDYTLIVSGVRLPSGEKGLIGLVGPKRMKYDKNLSVIEYMAKLLGSGLGVYVILMNF